MNSCLLNSVISRSAFVGRIPCMRLLVLVQLASVSAKTMRYRQGSLQNHAQVLQSYDSISVADVRRICQSTPECVTFSYYSEHSRFPPENVTAWLYPYADWHFREDELKSFIEESGYHTYVNTTREIELVIDEVDLIMSKLKALRSDTGNTDREKEESGSDGKLRGGGSSQRSGAAGASAKTFAILNTRKIQLLSALFDATFAKAHKPIAAPLIVRHILSLATSAQEADEVRLDALRLLIVLADTPHTGKMLIDDNVYGAMKSLIGAQESWGDISITALDVISNICLHRGANDKLHRLGAHHFMRSMMNEEGFPGLQATLALSHLSDEEGHFDIGPLPRSKLDDLVQLLKNAIDGDIVYDIKWDLIPGPLSAVKFLVLHSSDDSVQEGLLDAGLMEQLLRILEENDCIDGDSVEYALETMFGLVRASERAKHMVLLAEHTINEAMERLSSYERSAKIVSGLLELAANDGRDEL